MMAVCKGDGARVASSAPPAAACGAAAVAEPQLVMKGVRFGSSGAGGGGGAAAAAAAGGDEGGEVFDEIDVDLREVYFLIMHFLSSGPCQKAGAQLWNELLQHKLLPRRYHGIHSRNGASAVDESDDGSSVALNYVQVAERYKNVEKNHLIKLLQQLLVHDKSASMLDASVPRPLTAADVPTLLGSGAFSLLESEQRSCPKVSLKGLELLRWPHWQAHQVHALTLRELGGGFAKHRRAPSVRTANHVIVKPSMFVDRIKITKLLRGHRNAVYCAVFDHSGRYLVTGSDDRLVKIWSADTGLCLRSCRGHEGDITDLSVSHSNTLVATASNDSSIRIWRLPDGVPVSVLRGHTAGVTAIEFSPRHGCEHHLLSSSEDGTCRIWDARDSSVNSRVYMPKPPDELAGSENSTRTAAANQILCCSFNADGSFFVTGSSDKLARVWDARRWDEVPGRPNHELDVLCGHENVVNYVQFSGCAEPVKVFPADTFKEDNLPRFKNSWFAQDSIVTCSRDGTAIIWSPRPRKQVKLGRWVKAYHLKVPPPPMPQPPAKTGGPRQRLVQTPRGVNMIVWSLDNRFVMAAIMDCRICVWNAVDGSLVHCLTGHSKQTYVLDVHPFNPRIAMSAGYDGRVIIWDIWEGRPMKTYETADYNLVDGCFSPDGMSLVVSDEVGQFYLFSTGTGTSQEEAKYDQFFLGDYRPLVRDTHGNVLDQETQLPPHQRNLQDLLCDATMLPYPEPDQSIYQQRRLGALGIGWRPPAVQLAVGTFDDPAYIPPEIPQLLEPAPQHEQAHGQGNRWVEQPAEADAMDFEEDVAGLSDDSGSDYCASEESLSDEGPEESASMHSTESENEPEEIDFDEGVSTRTARAHRRKRKEELEIAERRAKRIRLEEHHVDPVGERRRRRAGKLSRAAQMEGYRPMRMAARNALNMFSSLHEEEEDEGAAAQPSAAAISSENHRVLRNGKAIREADDGGEAEPSRSAVETSEMGECRRPRSQRKLVLKLRNCTQALNPAPTPEFSDFTETEPSKRDEAVHGESDSRNDGPRSSEEVKGKRRMSWRKGTPGKRGRYLCQTSSEGSAEQEVKEENQTPAGEEQEDANDSPPRLPDASDSPPHLPDMNDSPPHLPDMNDSPPHLPDMNDSPPHTPIKLRLKVHRLQNGAGPSDEQEPESSEKSLSEEYLDEQRKERRHQMMPGNESLRNGGEDPDPDYREEVSPASNSEEAYKPEASDEPEDDFFKRRRPKAVYSRRHRKPPAEKATPPDVIINNNTMNEAETSNGSGRRRSSRLAQGSYSRAPVVAAASRMSTRNQGKARRVFHDDWSSDEEWSKSSLEGGDEGFASGRRTSTRLRGKILERNVSRYRDYQHSRRDQALVHRNPSHVSWLLLTEIERTRFIPQFGDQVVYFRQGHQDYLDNKQLDDDGPWRTLRGDLRAVEFCKLTGLEYIILPDGNTCCELTLEFCEGYRKRSRSFSLRLPELTDIADFIVERSRYDSSVARRWASRDKCQVWWRSDEEEGGGSWWEGRITEVRAKSAEFPSSPWDSISVQYKDEPQQPTRHSPWELHDLDNPGLWEQPRIDDDDTRELLQTIDEVLNNQSKDEYGLWRLQQAVSKPDFLDRIPLPITMDIIRSRLEKNYYRSLAAVGHDLRILIYNFGSYFGKDNSSVLKVQRLRDRFSEVLRGVNL